MGVGSRPTFGQANAFHNKVEDTNRALAHATRGGPFQRAYHTDTGDEEADPNWQADHPRYPDYYYPDDKERDTLKAAKFEIARHTPFVVHADQSDLDYMLDKKNMQEMAMFEAFLEDSIPRGTPWKAAYFEKICPGWTKRKEEIIDAKLQILGNLIKMTIRSPDTADEFFTIWHALNGRIEIPTTIEEIIHGSPTNRIPADAFASGLLCPKLWINEQTRLTRRNAKFLANFAIPGIDLKGAGAGKVPRGSDKAASAKSAGLFSYGRTRPGPKGGLDNAFPGPQFLRPTEAVGPTTDAAGNPVAAVTYPPWFTDSKGSKDVGGMAMVNI